MFTVNEAPSFLVVPEPREVRQGTELKLTCKARGKPLPMVAWLNADKKIIDSDRTVTTVKANDDKLEVESVFTVKPVEASDESDQYQITAVNSFGQAEHSFSLSVNQAPAFTYIPELVELISGQEGVVECRATGRPLPKISWTKGRKDQDNIKEETLATETVGKLIFARVTEDDAGKYTAKAKNSVDSVKEEIPVTGNYHTMYDRNTNTINLKLRSVSTNRKVTIGYDNCVDIVISTLYGWLNRL